jgi:hypothetical protein
MRPFAFTESLLPKPIALAKPFMTLLALALLGLLQSCDGRGDLHSH